MVLIGKEQVEMLPSYGSQEYWNKRFTTEPEPFECLEAPDTLDPFLRGALNRSDDPNPELLHIGCGTSMLLIICKPSFRSPSAYIIWTNWMSQSNWAISKRKSCATMNASRTSKVAVRPLNVGAGMLSICWTTNRSSVHVRIRLPYAVDVWSEGPTNMDLRRSPEPVHPLHILAVHLALVSKPRAWWIALSYSGDRFPFVDGLYSSRPHLPGFPDTGTLCVSIYAYSGVACFTAAYVTGGYIFALFDSLYQSTNFFLNYLLSHMFTLWKLLDTREIQSEKEPTVDINGNRVIHRPKTSHWVCHPNSLVSCDTTIAASLA
ncbi:hypothetical protein CC86DRAFT_380416 [Ophiobolus disseminans]|uniref:Uncharacterized protein n=1 Tax=Ophiobolus disseminans TaxID=1469910 RepID=A0A6A7A5Q3_9PLEO|nr:hypothetical protein CC86DRAFT_380416 [Ophiobolus disseminans]